MAQGCICIAINLDKIDIYMKYKHKYVQNGNTSQMHESSKLDYTSTFNEYK